MVNDEVRDAALRYGAVAGPVTAVVLVALAVAVNFPLKLLGALLVGVPLFVAPAIVGITDVGIETAAASARIGASTGQPEQYQAGSVFPVPNALEVVCWLAGVFAVGVVVFAIAG